MPKRGRKAGSSVGGSTTNKGQVKVQKVKIDCSTPLNDGVIDGAALVDFAEYLTKRIKINGKTENLGNLVTVNTDDAAGDVVVETAVHLSKRYIKYLAKKFLARKIITTDSNSTTWRSLFRIQADKRDSFKLKYVVTADDDEEADE